MDRQALLGMFMMVVMAVLSLLSHTVVGQDNSTEAGPTQAPCPCENGVCTRKSDSSVSCLCDRHWTGDNCDQEIGRCLEANPCNDVNAECFNRTNTVMGFRCECKFGFYKDEEDGKCKEHLLWPGYSTEFQGVRINTTPDSQNEYIRHTATQYPIPFFSNSAMYVTQTDAGFMKLGDIAENSVPEISRFVRSKWPALPFYIAPYWSKFRYERGAQVFYSHATVVNRTERDMAPSLLPFAKSLIQAESSTDAEFDPVEAFSCTWVNVFPRKCSDPYCDERATFQVVLATDLQYTYAIITWHKLFSRSQLSDGPEVVSGHSNPDRGFVSLASEAKPKSRTILRLFSTGQPTAHPMTCVRAIETVTGQRDFSSLTKCPCQEKDIELDFRFMHIPGESTAERQAYQEKFSVGGLKQVCYYNSLGLHISDPMTAGLPIEDTPGTPSLQAIKTLCCAITPTFCLIFNMELPECRPTPVLKTTSGGGNSAVYMTSFSGDKYTFNGWGEYILVQSGQIEFQARTQRNGDTNTTSFSAFAVQVANSASFQIYVTPEGALASGWTQSISLDPSVFIVDTPAQNTLTITAFGGTLKVERLADSSQANGVSNSLAFIITLPVEAPTRGLCGNSDSRETPASDDTEQWRVANSSMSLFDYTKPSVTSFEDVNVHEGFTPEVLPMEAAQVLALFTDEAKRNQASELCGQHIFCLQEFYLSGNVGGTASTVLNWSREMTQIVNDIERAQPEVQKLTLSQARNLPSKIISGITIDITVTSPAPEGVTLALQGSFSELENVSMDGNTLNMMGLNMTTLRGLEYPQSLGIIATDSATNLSSVYEPRLYLCLCEEDYQCVGFPNVWGDRDRHLGLNGNVILIECKCNKLSNPETRFTGRFCEEPLDVCTDCFNETLCDSTKIKDYCGCPEHMDGDGFLCRDIDECTTDNGGCQQICSNTHMGAMCSCESGYATNGSRCIEINECIENLDICNSTSKYCFNTPGSYECKCYGDGIGADCVNAPYIYSLNVQLAPVAGQRWSDISGTSNMAAKNQLETRLEQAIKTKLTTGSSAIGTADDLVVETGGFSELQQRSRRAVDRDAEIGATVVVRSKSLVTDTDMNAALSLGDCQSNCDMAGILVYSEPELQPDSELCNVGVVNTCDVQTTTCVTVADNRVMCQCLSGFETAQDPSLCQDINECTTGAHTCSGQSICTNTFGSYTCSCATGYYWNQTSASCMADACYSNPCQKDWNCHLTDGSASYVCSPKSGSVGTGDDDVDDWRTAVIVVSCALGTLCLILLIVVIVLAIRRKKALEMDAYSNSRYNDLAGNPRQQGYNKRGSATEMAEQRSRRNVYDAPGRNGDYTSAYDNRSYSNDRL